MLTYLKPVDNLIYIDRFTYSDTVGDSTIIMPERVKDGTPPPLGRIFAIGPGQKKHQCADCLAKTTPTRVPAPDLAVGDVVFWSAFDGKPYQLEHEGELIEFVILPDDIVLGKLVQ